MVKRPTHHFLADCRDFFTFFFYYIQRKTVISSRTFERNKNRLVKFFMTKRGRYNRPFLHMTTMGVLAIGVLVAPTLADTYPIFSSRNTSVLGAAIAAAPQSINVDQNVFETKESSKPRDQIVTYTVESGDTVESIAKKFSSPNNPISPDTIRWANDLKSDDITTGDQLKILPVTGVAHKVEPGDTVYSIAKLYGIDAQAIVDYPFNDFANQETFALTTGEILIVPGGKPPVGSSGSTDTVPTPYVASLSGPVHAAGGGWYFPVGDSVITQYYSWYHQAIDIAGPVGTPVYAAHSGTIERVSYGTYDTGYGNNVWINDGDGIETHYAHLDSQGPIVSVGQQVIGGKTVIGYRGNTGRSTGPHTHFEIRVNGVLINPLQYVSP